MYRRWAPKCALPGCINHVGYHKKNGTYFKWKTVCEQHRKNRKFEVDIWKMERGCANVDSRHGFKCTSHITEPGQLDIHHLDGNRQNQEPENLEVLCKICHTRVSYSEEHHKNRYVNKVHLDKNLFEIV